MACPVLRFLPAPHRTAKGKGKAKGKAKALEDKKDRPPTKQELKKACKVCEKLNVEILQINQWQKQVVQLADKVPTALGSKLQMWLAQLTSQKSEIELITPEWVGDAQKAFGETADKMDEYEEFKPNVASMISAAEAL